MKEVHDFTTPRNLYEKLLRDSERLDKELSGDNIFNFMATAHSLQIWIKKSPMAQHETIKRLLRRAAKNQHIKECCAIFDGKKSFVLEMKKDSKDTVLKIEDQIFSPVEFKNDIVSLFRAYFLVK